MQAYMSGSVSLGYNSSLSIQFESLNAQHPKAIAAPQGVSPEVCLCIQTYMSGSVCLEADSSLSTNLSTPPLSIEALLSTAKRERDRERERERKKERERESERVRK